MIDLETMSTASNAAIVSIGAVHFDDTGIFDEFYVNIDLESCMKKGMKVDGSTVMWWLKQSDDARKALRGDNVPIIDALRSFRDWLPKGNLQVWGNGASFDNVILGNAYKAHNGTVPWPYYGDRCFRTFKCSFKGIEVPNVGEHHNALDDAKWQANYLIALVAKNKLKAVL